MAGEGEEGEKVSLKICLAGELNPGPKLYIPSTLNIDLMLWHTKLIVCAVKC